MIVFTNGCFDILHPGHIQLLQKARALGNRLIVGINSDSSVRSIKGVGRPIFSAEERTQVLLALNCVDEVRTFDELTPEKLIEEIKPDVLVKGGDWSEEEIIGSDFVRSRGGKVVSIPLVPGFSTSAILDRLMPNKRDVFVGDATDVLNASLDEHSEVISKLRDISLDSVRSCVDVLSDTLNSGKKILICGNGGSAADAQHLAAEFVGRYEVERRALSAIALTTDTSSLTALANDYSFDRVFARQVEALGQKGDCLIAISTSGTSKNIIAAVMAARNIGCTVIGMTGANGKKLASLCDQCVIVPSARTARIQEAHITIFHLICEMIDRQFAEGIVG